MRENDTTHSSASMSACFLSLPISFPEQTIHDASNPAEVDRVLAAGGVMSSTGRFQGVLEPSRTIGDVDIKAEAPKGVIASFPEVTRNSNKIVGFLPRPFVCCPFRPLPFEPLDPNYKNCFWLFCRLSQRKR